MLCIKTKLFTQRPNPKKLQKPAKKSSIFSARLAPKKHSWGFERGAPAAPSSPEIFGFYPKARSL